MPSSVARITTAIDGGTGEDSIAGGAGNDALTGGTGSDTFVFDTALNAGTNVDTLSDFVSGSDVLQLNLGIFTALESTDGVLDSGQLRRRVPVRWRAIASQRIILDTTSGSLFYDADGSRWCGADRVCPARRRTHGGGDGFCDRLMTSVRPGCAKLSAHAGRADYIRTSKRETRDAARVHRSAHGVLFEPWHDLSRRTIPYCACVPSTGAPGNTPINTRWVQGERCNRSRRPA